MRNLAQTHLTTFKPAPPSMPKALSQTLGRIDQQLSELIAVQDPQGSTEPMQLAMHAGLGLLSKYNLWFVSQAQFSNERYVRRLIRAYDSFYLYVMGWRPGQMSAAHDHGGGLCALKVLSGVAFEKIYGTEPTQLHLWRTGETALRGRSEVHELGNLRSSRMPLVTLHLYTVKTRDAQVYTQRELNLLSVAHGSI